MITDEQILTEWKNFIPYPFRHMVRPVLEKAFIAGFRIGHEHGWKLEQESTGDAIWEKAETNDKIMDRHPKGKPIC